MDRGGTFTDVLGLDPEGRIHADKLLSESVQYDDAVLEGIRRMIGQRQTGPLSEATIQEIRLGTTVATNALLERKGAPVALLATKGLEDAIAIGHGARPDIFARAIDLPAPLYAQVHSVTERIDATGRVLIPLDDLAVESTLHAVRDSGIRAIAVVLAHAWKNPLHERRIKQLARQFGLDQVSVSSEVMPLIKFVSRGQTTLVDAYLTPVLKRYIARVGRGTGTIRTLFMQNAGGLTEADRFSGKDAILSGPAGGVVGCAAVARQNAIEQAIGFDMGGTSTDVCRFDGSFEKVFETTTGGIPFQTPMLNVLTIAAGGGSMLGFDGQKLTVGPKSAGADPGPACYGFGGPAALTDANAVLGRLLPSFFPRQFGPNRDASLPIHLAREALLTLTDHINDAIDEPLSVEQAALGFLRIANEKMCRPIKQLTISRGRDIRRHTLICFGGAAGQHACGIARILGIRTVVVPHFAGLLSAYGIATSDHVRSSSQAWLKPYSKSKTADLEERFDEMTRPLMKDLMNRGIFESKLRIEPSLDLRPEGTDEILNLPYLGHPQTLDRFYQAYRRRYGFEPSDGPVEIAALRVEVHGEASLLEPTQAIAPPLPAIKGRPVSQVQTWFEQGRLDTAVYHRNTLAQGQCLCGPAIVVERDTTVLVEPGFEATVAPTGHLLLQAIETKQPPTETRWDPITLEVFNHLFMSVAEQMGKTLAQTAHSTNIRERLDFSCAVFDRNGDLVANAPHIPVHLGAMGETVRALIRHRGAEFQSGDVFVSNNPFRGGSHLPDVTMMMPVFDPAGELIFFAANRGHHADIGGITPGSMPSEATRIDQEGVVLDNLLIVRDGTFDESSVRDILCFGPHPARNINERLSDLRAQIAANQTGIHELNNLIDRHGLPRVLAYMGYIQENAAFALRQALMALTQKNEAYSSSFADALDDGSRIQVSVRIEPGKKIMATVDFTGTDPQLPGNLNAPYSVTRSAVLYVFRMLIDRDIPLNEGCLRPVRLIVPEGCLLNPRPPAAVVGGNVETSQRVVDVLCGALGIAAASQGTMNNLAFGSVDGSGKQYYETLPGGSGAIAEHPGASAVQVHMTNTRLTDVEVLEHRFPEVRVERFSIRKNSGGAGRWAGGDGVIRAIRFLQPRQVSILSERRSKQPFGLHGGEPGKAGRNTLIDTLGRSHALPSKTTRLVQAGETVVLKTPGGGGWGKPDG